MVPGGDGKFFEGLVIAASPAQPEVAFQVVLQTLHGIEFRAVRGQLHQVHILWKTQCPAGRESGSVPDHNGNCASRYIATSPGNYGQPAVSKQNARHWISMRPSSIQRITRVVAGTPVLLGNRDSLTCQPVGETSSLMAPSNRSRVDALHSPAPEVQQLGELKDELGWVGGVADHHADSRELRPIR